MIPRTRRLLADAELMNTEFAGHPLIRVEPIGWDPPERYRVTLAVPGASIDRDTGQPVVTASHTVLITLPAGYPREKPYCVTESQVFHPNFGQEVGSEICIGDYWTPAQTLVDIVVKIGEMLQFRNYNVRSPLNAVAARWVIENEHVFPLGNIELFQAEPSIKLPGAEKARAGPATTGKTASDRKRPTSRGRDVPEGSGWWLASDGKYYPPELSPGSRRDG